MTTWSPVSIDGANVGLCLPINSIAARLATLPRTASFASITCQARLMSCLDGYSVRMDRLILFARNVEHLSLANYKGGCQTQRIPGSGSLGSGSLRKFGVGYFESCPAFKWRY